MLCEKNILPKAEIVTYTSKCKCVWSHKLVPGVPRPHFEEPDWNDPRFAKEEPPSEIDSYMDTCEEDSGAGNFITNGEKEDPENVKSFKFVLAAITNGGIPDFLYVNGDWKKIPCGSNTIDEYDDTRRFTRGYSSRITLPKIFHWIKEKAQLENI